MLASHLTRDQRNGTRRGEAAGRLLELLLALGADTRRHSSGTLFDHLVGTAATLQRWGARDALWKAGLFHSCYGTASYGEALLRLDRRAIVRARIGREAEELVWLCSRLDRRSVFAEADGIDLLYRHETGFVSAAAHADLAWLFWAKILDHLPHRARPPERAAPRRLPADLILRLRAELDRSRSLLPPIAERELRAALEAPLWRSHTDPFPFVTAQGVFSKGVYDSLARSFREVLARGLFEKGAPDGCFRRATWAREAFSCVLPEASPGFEPFRSRRWHALVARELGIEAKGEISIALHHHRGGDSRGHPHDDSDPLDENEGVTVHESMRAAAVLFYLENDGWLDGDGAETRLYRTENDAFDAPTAPIAPIDNSLVAFRCTPHSFRAFIGNLRGPRNALVMWLHRSRSEVIDRWELESLHAWR